MAVVQASRGFLQPASEYLLSEPAIVARLATATLGVSSNISWQELSGNYDLIREHIARVVPGFDDYNARVRRPDLRHGASLFGFIFPVRSANAFSKRRVAVQSSPCIHCRGTN